MSDRKQGRHGHRHRHRHHRKKQRRKLFLVVALMTLIVAAGSGIGIYRTFKIQESRHVTAENAVNMADDYRTISYNGKKYQYNSLITTILYAGIDSEGELEKTAYSRAPRADSINLVVLDKKHKKITIIAFNRNTITEIPRCDLTGKRINSTETFLAYGYSYGNGLESSCENLKEAVSNLLGGIPINEYIATNRSSMIGINDLVGGVTVTVPNDDLEEDYPELKKGAVVTLDETNIEAFLRSRDIEVDFSNNDRMERQQVYMTAYIDQFKTMVQQDLSGTWDKIQKIDEFALTSITKNKYLDLANLLQQVSLEEDSYYTPEGENVSGDFYDEFYVDEKALMEKVIELFYDEI